MPTLAVRMNLSLPLSKRSRESALEEVVNFEDDYEGEPSLLGETRERPGESVFHVQDVPFPDTG